MLRARPADPPGLSLYVIASASLLPCCVFLLSDIVSVNPAPNPFLCLSNHSGWGQVSSLSPSSLTLLGRGSTQLRAGWGHSVIHWDLGSRKTSGLDTFFWHVWQICWFTWLIWDGNVFFLWQKATFSCWYVVMGVAMGKILPPPAERRQFYFKDNFTSYISGTVAGSKDSQILGNITHFWSNITWVFFTFGLFTKTSLVTLLHMKRNWITNRLMMSSDFCSWPRLDVWRNEQLRLQHNVTAKVHKPCSHSSKRKPITITPADHGF